MEAVKNQDTTRLNNGILSAVSHELRTPLTMIKGYTSMLIDYSSELTDEDIKEYIQSIDNATDMMTRLIDNLLDTSRLEEGRLILKKIPVNMINLIKEVTGDAETKDKNHEFLVALDDNLPRVYVDPKIIQQVLHNLIENAARCSPKGTEVLISLATNDQGLEISVTGRDPGIPDSKYCTISDLVYRMERMALPEANDTKLRLYMCQRMVEAHDGQIWAESIEGKGTTIKLTLPLC